MTRLGTALIKSELGLFPSPDDQNQGVKWLQRAAKEATETYARGIYELACLHEHGFQSFVYRDHPFMMSLLQTGCSLADPWSHCKVAQGYETGSWGLIHSHRDAYEHYIRAARKDHPEVNCADLGPLSHSPLS